MRLPRGHLVKCGGVGELQRESGALLGYLPVGEAWDTSQHQACPLPEPSQGPSVSVSFSQGHGPLGSGPPSCEDLSLHRQL